MKAARRRIKRLFASQRGVARMLRYLTVPANIKRWSDDLARAAAAKPEFLELP